MNSSITDCKETKIWELMAEIDRLKQENIELKIDNNLLHNMIENQNNNKEFLTVVDGADVDMSYVDDYAQALAEAQKDYKF